MHRVGNALVAAGALVLVFAAPALAQTEFTTTTTGPTMPVPPGCISTFADAAGVLRPATTFVCPSSTTTTSPPVSPTTDPETTVPTVHHDTTTSLAQDPCAPVELAVSLAATTVLNPYQPPRFEGSGAATVDPLGDAVASISVFSLDDDEFVGHLALALADGSTLESSQVTAHLDGATVEIDAPIDAGSGEFARVQSDGSHLSLHGTWDDLDGGTLALSGTGRATAFGCDDGVDVGPAGTGTVAPPVDDAAHDEPDTLPRTGNDPVVLALIGITLVATGLGLATRHRRATHVH